MDNRLTAIKNLIWSVCIVVSLVAVLFGILYSIFQPYNGEKLTFSLNLNSTQTSAPVSNNEIIGADDAVTSSSSSSGNARGELNVLSDLGSAAPDSYLSDDSVKFLVDSTFIGLRTKNLIGVNQVWGTSSGSMSIASINDALIKFPNDGSEISAANAAMITKPRILYIGIGTDGLSTVDENTFVANYTKLINDIKASSPDTTIVCMGLCSVTESYSGVDGLSITVMSDGNDWIKLVCRDTGSYYLDVSEGLGDGSGGLRSSYTEANGKTLNSSGLGIVLQCVRQHAVQ